MIPYVFQLILELLSDSLHESSFGFWGNERSIAASVMLMPIHVIGEKTVSYVFIFFMISIAIAITTDFSKGNAPEKRNKSTMPSNSSSADRISRLEHILGGILKLSIPHPPIPLSDILNFWLIWYSSYLLIWFVITAHNQMVHYLILIDFQLLFFPFHSNHCLHLNQHRNITNIYVYHIFSALLFGLLLSPPPPSLIGWLLSTSFFPSGKSRRISEGAAVNTQVLFL